MAESPNDATFVIGVTDLRALAEQKGWRYEDDAAEQRVIRQDGTVAIRVKTHTVVPKKKDPTVWMRSLRPHTYEGKPQDEGSIYLAAEDIADTIEINKMGVRETPPARAVRRPQDQAHQTMMANLPKRKLSDSWALEITTAPDHKPSKP